MARSLVDCSGSCIVSLSLPSAALKGINRMYIVAIGWIFVAAMIAITSPTIISGVLSFLFYGVFPLALLLWLFGGPRRRKSLPARTDDAEPDQAAKDAKPGID
jgi:hypothetical protein